MNDAQRKMMDNFFQTTQYDGGENWQKSEAAAADPDDEEAEDSDDAESTESDK